MGRGTQGSGGPREEARSGAGPERPHLRPQALRLLNSPQAPRLLNSPQALRLLNVKNRRLCTTLHPQAQHSARGSTYWLFPARERPAAFARALTDVHDERWTHVVMVV